MSLEIEAISRSAERHRQEYEFFTELESLMREKPDFFRRLEAYLKGDTVTATKAPNTVAPPSATNGNTKIDVILKILNEEKAWMSSMEISKAAEKKGFTVASKNPRHAFSAALSAEKQKETGSRIAYYKRKWGLAQWVVPDSVDVAK